MYRSMVPGLLPALKHPVVDLDAWDGYRANRARVLDHLQQNNISNTIILAGDSHANWVSDLARQCILSFIPNLLLTYNISRSE